MKYKTKCNFCLIITQIGLYVFEGEIKIFRYWKIEVYTAQNFNKSPYFCLVKDIKKRVTIKIE